MTQQQATPQQMVPPVPLFSHIQTNSDLSTELNWKSPRLLTRLGQNKSEHYSILFLRKKGASGSLRKLHNPDGLMRAVQLRILNKILEKVEIPEYVYAFERGKNIPDMAQHHVGKGTVISLDIKDFFTSIKQRQLQELFGGLGFGDKPARTLSELCTYESFVPQGAITSPKISNIITAHTFGPVLKEYCDQHGFTLTIYADDITISSDNDIVKEAGYGAAMEIVSYVSQLVRGFGFVINRKKTKVMRPFQRQYVCGAVVNHRVNLQKSERNNLGTIVYYAGRYGVADQAARMNLTVDEFVNKTMGRLNWFGQLNPEAGARLKSTFKEILGKELQGQDGAVVETADAPNTIQVTVATTEPVSVSPFSG